MTSWGIILEINLCFIFFFNDFGRKNSKLMRQKKLKELLLKRNELVR